MLLCKTFKNKIKMILKNITINRRLRLIYYKNIIRKEELIRRSLLDLWNSLICILDVGIMGKNYLLLKKDCHLRLLIFKCYNV